MQKAIEPVEAAVLNKLSDDWFAAGEYWRAGLAYHAAPQSDVSLEAAKAAEARALQFRVELPRYAQAKLKQAVESLIAKVEKMEQRDAGDDEALAALYLNYGLFMDAYVAKASCRKN